MRSLLRFALVVVGVGVGFTPATLLVAGGVAAGAPDPSVDTACAGTLSGTTFTLTANCDTTVQLTVPDGQTVIGAGHIITAHDPGAGHFSGAVLTNAGSSMTIADLTIEGTGFAIFCGGQQLMGIFFLNATGSVSNVKVENITQHSGCPLGQAIRANSVDGTHRTVTLTNVTTPNYQKSGLVASGTITVNVSGSTLGPPDSLKTIITQNGVQYGGAGVNAGAGGTITSSTIYGSGFGVAGNDSTAVLLYGASGVTLAGDTLTGSETDVGVAVVADSTGANFVRNQIGRTTPDTPDSYGIGVKVDPGSSASLTCNSFSGWLTNLMGVTQPPCITGSGYWLTAADGGVFAFGAAPFMGSAGNLKLDAPVIGIAGTPDGGYWVAAKDGGVFSYGVPFMGSMGGTPFNEPVVGIASTPDGGGYYLVAADGGVFTFGDAHFRGSMGGTPLNKPVVGIAVTWDNGGYYLVAADGGVFTFGDAVFQGSKGGFPLNAPMVGMAVGGTTFGYWLVDNAAGVFAFGVPLFNGGLQPSLNAPAVGMAGTDDDGYRIVAADGGVFCFGDAAFQGSMGATPLNAPMVGMASTG
jgi:hypothetical protein